MEEGRFQKWWSGLVVCLSFAWEAKSWGLKSSKHDFIQVSAQSTNVPINWLSWYIRGFKRASFECQRDFPDHKIYTPLYFVY